MVAREIHFVMIKWDFSSNRDLIKKLAPGVAQEATNYTTLVSKCAPPGETRQLFNQFYWRTTVMRNSQNAYKYAEDKLTDN